MRAPRVPGPSRGEGEPQAESSGWRRWLREAGRAFGIGLSDDQLDLFEAYLSALLAWNRRVNLTAITEPNEVAALHFLDSLTCLAVSRFDANARVIDVGSGAGFPGIPIAISRPDLHVTLLESTGRKCRFLDHVITTLALPGVSVDCRRAEMAGQDPSTRESFDIAVTRAVAELAVLAELCLPLLKMGGVALVMKGPKAESEIARGGGAMAVLGGRLEFARPLALPVPSGTVERVVLGIRKISATPQGYPRAPGVPARRPLGIDRGAGGG